MSSGFSKINIEEGSFTFSMGNDSRRDRFCTPMTPWTHAASPLEHWTLATGPCDMQARRDGWSEEERDECNNAHWAEHLRLCGNCANEEAKAAAEAAE